MKIEYDRSVDAAYIEITSSRAHGSLKTREAGAGISLDFEAGGKLFGIEVLDARHHLRADVLAAGVKRMDR